MKKLITLVLGIAFVYSCSSNSNENGDTQSTQIPSITTTTVSSITSNSAVSGGIITNNGGTVITARGVCWSTNTNPTIALTTKTIDGIGNNNFNSQISNLDPNTEYFIRAYATNSNGTGYGSLISFKTTFAPIVPGNGFTDISGITYPTLIINNKIWSSKNLAVKKYNNGDVIPQVTNALQWSNLTTGAWCYYNNDSNNESYGVLYNWYAVNDPRGLAPTGWHIPSDNEWSSLQRYLIIAGFNYDGDLTASTSQGLANDKLGKAIASTTFQNGTSTPPSLGSTGSPSMLPNLNNRTGFSALGSGLRGSDGAFQWLNQTERWWSTTTFTLNNLTYVKHRWIVGQSTFGFNDTSGALRTSGFSIRVIKN